MNQLLHFQTPFLHRPADTTPVRLKSWPMLYSCNGIAWLKSLSKTRKALWLALEHDVPNTAKAVAYSGMLMLFPDHASGHNPSGRNHARRVRPSSAKISRYVRPLSASRHHVAAPAVFDPVPQHIAFFITALLRRQCYSIFAGLGTMLSLMEGFRRAYRLPREEWGFWQRRLRALLLVPVVHVPLALATLVLVFGHEIEHWMIQNAAHELRFAVLLFWRMVRWAIAVTTSISVLGALYHFGTKRKEHWMLRHARCDCRRQLPGFRPHWPSDFM